MMADLSDSPEDCAVATRCGSGRRTYDYPGLKVVLNRVANAGIRLLFQHGAPPSWARAQARTHTSTRITKSQVP
jgi:hypothetical protein